MKREDRETDRDIWSNWLRCVVFSLHRCRPPGESFLCMTSLHWNWSLVLRIVCKFVVLREIDVPITRFGQELLLRDTCGHNRIKIMMLAVKSRRCEGVRPKARRGFTRHVCVDKLMSIPTLPTGASRVLNLVHTDSTKAHVGVVLKSGRVYDPFSNYSIDHLLKSARCG